MGIPAVEGAVPDFQRLATRSLALIHPGAAERDGTRAIDLDRRVVLDGVDADHEHRRKVETFIWERFARAYGANIKHFLPLLLSLGHPNGKVAAACGCRAATHTPLFLETYLDAPIESVLASGGGAAPVRESIVEVGNLAARDHGSSRWIIVSLADTLSRLGFQWVVFTCTPKLKNSFRRLGIELHSLGEADGDRLGPAKADWGSYYDTRPRVMAADIQQGRDRLERKGVFEALRFQRLELSA